MIGLDLGVGHCGDHAVREHLVPVHIVTSPVYRSTVKVTRGDSAPGVGVGEVGLRHFSKENQRKISTLFKGKSKENLNTFQRKISTLFKGKTGTFQKFSKLVKIFFIDFWAQ